MQKGSKWKTLREQKGLKRERQVQSDRVFDTRRKAKVGTNAGAVCHRKTQRKGTAGRPKENLMGRWHWQGSSQVRYSIE